MDMKMSIPQKREKIRLRRNKNALMGLSQKDAVPFLLYSMSLQAVTAQKNHQEHFAISSGTFCKIIEKIFSSIKNISPKASAEDVFKILTIANHQYRRSIMKS